MASPPVFPRKDEALAINADIARGCAANAAKALEWAAIAASALGWPASAAKAFECADSAAIAELEMPAELSLAAASAAPFAAAAREGKT